jgi:putative hydrolase of the HAD superfamily
MLRGVIFDLGSTLIRFNGEFSEVRREALDALVRSLRGEGIGVHEASFLGRFIRDLDEADLRRNRSRLEQTTFDILAGTLRALDVSVPAADILRMALKEMYEVYEARWKLYPGAHAVLREVRSLELRQALLSNAGDEANVRRLLTRHRLGAFFQPVVISAAIGIRKPDSRAFRPILDAWKIPTDQIAMVGDQLGMDILGGQELGMRTIWIRTEEASPTNREFLGRVIPDADAASIREVGAILRGWYG